ncbi:DUF952 domain-containing protein [Mycolicibacterium sp.]|uniref:DUF952 domain-containing protein n=1 Tax=Mycolicibacterium sp. TaxID=2320850 RepID=UPI001D91E895|nr:DUF952 domain-containing protein [Mycolicibacterium sp.]MCB1291598.1 DUF952 domain-containing protein [Mycobacterium sp.]MCB9408370.1 DUF952 domain-containing protein [Mycolicibacterium sp.]
MAEHHCDPELLVHLCGRRDWDRASAAGEIRPDSLREVGFVHLSTQQQVHLPANRIFAGRPDLLVLYIDRSMLAAPLRWEPGVPGDPASMLFPHLYGSLPTGAVVAVRPYPLGADGRFPPLIGKQALVNRQAAVDRRASNLPGSSSAS